jgi:surface antigen
MRACIIAATVLTLSVTSFTMTQPAQADKYDDQISALEKEISQYDANAKKLSAKAVTLESQLARLNNERDRLQAQIDKNQLKHDKLVAKIAQAEQDIQNNKKALGITLRDYYLEGKTSTLELLASSDNITEFVDKQAYRESMQKSLSTTVKKIESLKAQLVKDKEAVKAVLDDMNEQKKALVEKENEKKKLISQTRGQESTFQSLIHKQSKRIKQLRAQQVIANQRFISGGSYAAGNGPACGGGYPGRWCNIAMDSVADDWGMFNRECVSYTAFKVWQSGRRMPFWGGSGNANQWPGNARRAGISVTSSPRAGDVAISYAGYYGHAMYVESVNGNGTINISQYNAAYNGTYSTNTINAGGLEFIHFR